MSRPQIPEVPVAPYPVVVPNTRVVAGFGRGSSSIGIPTANVPVEDIPAEALRILDTGVYFGWCKVLRADEPAHTELRKDGTTEVEFSNGEGLVQGQDADVVLPMVMSIGWNPFFKNKEKAAELHILHKFPKNFYGAKISFVVLGYVRPELSYTTLEALIEDINLDIASAKEYLAKDAYVEYKHVLN
ncbi:unnamed protein product [Kuraishia capsulata CBS 1993]|uniref:Riboflavin kinase n=1 Tax=Kuraishia capsulata CBS 1993 TaxID=1382522 RepID=W6MNQ6_9ASCO|nr:uncharacterized protein KUCA_T00004248001 [Kuraishia capsulata CBS 1993]CDK28266.1 unnamed protein product [Kuraishia capsulata CBS 1993]